MKCGNVWVSIVEDCDENKSGYFCQVYKDEDMQEEIDNFCIHTNDCDCKSEDEVTKFIQEYVKQYS